MMKTGIKLFFGASHQNFAGGKKSDNPVNTMYARLKNAQPVAFAVSFEAHKLGTPILINNENSECAQQVNPVL